MKKLSKIIFDLKDHFIILLGSNLTGLLNLVYALIILKIGSETEYNTYTAYASFFLILTAPNKIFKSLATAYGSDLLGIIRIRNEGKYLLASLSFLIFSSLLYLITRAVDGNYIATLFLLLSVIIQFAVFIHIGFIQNLQNFLKASLILFFQNFSKLVLGLILFSILSNIGIWFALFTTLVVALIYLLHQSKQENKFQNKLEINFKDIGVNLLILACVELFFNIDSILVVGRLSTSDAHAYNSLVLIKKSLFFSVFGITQIILAKSRKQGVNTLLLLLKNIIIALGIGFGLGLFFYIIKVQIFELLELEPAYYYLFNKFLIASVIFSIFMITTTWFTSIKSYLIRILIIVSILSFIPFYYINITSLDNILNTFITGNLGLLLIEIFAIGFYFKNKVSS